MHKPDLKIAFLALTACLLWATAATAIKIGLRYCPPLLFASIRFILAGVLLVPFCGHLKNYLLLLGGQLKMVLLLSLFQTVILYALYFYGMTLIPGAVGAIVVGASPLASAVLSHFFSADDKLKTGDLLKILSGIIGVAIIALSRNPLTLEGARELLGILLVLCSSLASAAGNILVARQRQDINPIALNSLQIGIGGCALFLLSLILEGPQPINFTFEFSLALIWLAIVSAAAFSIWFYLLRRKQVPVSRLNVWKFVIPVFGAVLSWVLLPGEHPTLFTVLGMIVVAFSVILYYLPGKKSNQQKNR